MPATRDDSGRKSINEALFRKVNEGIDAGRGLVAADRRLAFRCECARLECAEMLELTVPEYEAVRRDARRFVVAPGHVDTNVERPVAEHPTHVVVEKVEAHAIVVAEATDPRDGSDEERERAG